MRYQDEMAADTGPLARMEMPEKERAVPVALMHLDGAIAAAQQAAVELYSRLEGAGVLRPERPVEEVEDADVKMLSAGAPFADGIHARSAEVDRGVRAVVVNILDRLEV